MPITQASTHRGVSRAAISGSDMDSHIRFALHLSGEARGSEIHHERDVAHLVSSHAPLWLHLSTDHPDTEEWIAQHLTYLAAPVREALLEPETRPRALWTGAGLLVILRVINVNAGEDPEDMVPVRLWLDAHRVVSLASSHVRAIATVADEVRAGGGPATPMALLAELVRQITDRIERHAAELEERVDGLEAATIAEPRDDLRKEVADQRLELTELRRYIQPQRDAIAAIVHIAPSLMEANDRAALLEQHDQLTRVAEQLEAQRERLQTLRDELGSAQAERLNRNLYVVSVISSVFLPLGFLTGLMGANLGGIPGENSSVGFWAFTGILALIGGGVLVVLRVARIL